MDFPALEEELRAYALGLPEAWEDFPWGERVAKVGKKVFLFLGRPENGLSLSVKLPASSPFALMFDCCAPTGYGLGKSGWVTVRLSEDSDLDAGLLPGWILESYQTIAPKKLAKLVG